MKIFKTAIISICLLNLAPINAKTYTDGTIQPNTLDMCIFLQKYQGKKTHEERSAEKSLEIMEETRKLIHMDEKINEALKSYRASDNDIPKQPYLFEAPAITRGVINTLLQTEAMIVSSPLIRALVACCKGVNLKIYKNVSDSLASNMWLIYKTRDNNFAVLIPKKKYPNVISQNLESISINHRNLELISENGISMDQLEEEFQADYQEPGDINLETLKSIFLMNNSINKRIFLNGHGHFSGSLVAQLKKHDCRDFLAFLGQNGCSLLHIASCYVCGKNIDAITKKMIKSQDDKIVRDIPFLLIAQGLSDAYIHGGQDIEIEKFFCDLNIFFTKQKERLVSLRQPTFQISRQYAKAIWDRRYNSGNCPRRRRRRRRNITNICRKWTNLFVS